jgi:hypothetical protein
MSIQMINDILSEFCLKMKLNLDSILIKSIKFDDESTYNVFLELNNELYSIRHYEPINMCQGVNYGAGPYHQYDIFDKKNKIFTRLNAL